MKKILFLAALALSSALMAEDVIGGILGGAIGGVIGNQFGGDDRRCGDRYDHRQRRQFQKL